MTQAYPLWCWYSNASSDSEWSSMIYFYTSLFAFARYSITLEIWILWIIGCNWSWMLASTSLERSLFFLLLFLLLPPPVIWEITSWVKIRIIRWLVHVVIVKRPGNVKEPSQKMRGEKIRKRNIHLSLYSTNTRELFCQSISGLEGLQIVSLV